MYKFVDLTEGQSFDSLPSVAMEYDGYLLENEIKGYRTLNVKGREMLNVNLETENPSGRNGTYIVGQTLPHRELIVTYMLKVDSNEEFQYSYSLLMKKLLKDDDVEIRFADQPDVHFEGRYFASDDVPDNRNGVISSFSIYCQNPHKHRENVTLTGNPLTVGFLSHYSMKPDEIRLVLGAATTKLTVDNLTTGRHIILNGSYAAGDEIKIRIPENTITKNGQNIMKNLDPQESDFHNFLVNNEDTINVTPDSEVSLSVRGLSL